MYDMLIIYIVVTCITNFGKIHEKPFQVIAPQSQIIDVKCKKIGYFDLFSAIIALVRELVTSNMFNKFGKGS